MRTALGVAGVLLAAVCTVAGCGGAQGQLANVQPEPMPAGGDWDGVYQSPAYGRMEFTVDGNQVTGLYEGERHFGRIDGTFEGDLLTFKWTQWKSDLQGKQRETTGHGYFKYVLQVEQATTKTREVHRLEGEWGFGESMVGNPWSAVKLSKRAKKILEPHQVADTEDSGDDLGASAGFDVGGDSAPEPSAPEPEPEEEPEESAPSIDDLF